MALIECIPNVSEGRRLDVIAAMADAIRAVDGIRLLDYSSDPSHNRSVFTLAGTADGLERAVGVLFERAIAAIDLRTHRGEHPRLGAVDVVPFVPIEDVSMAECVALARKVGAEVARRFSLPVYLYEEASVDPSRRTSRTFDAASSRASPPRWPRPDGRPISGRPRPIRPRAPRSSGRGWPLIAYNINLATDRLDVAKKIASAIRQSSGGFRFVKALGIPLAERGIVQVSMNLTNYEQTPIFLVFDAVKREAARYGVTVLESEIVGLVPAAALTATAEHYLQLAHFTSAQVLESTLKER